MASAYAYEEESEHTNEAPVDSGSLYNYKQEETSSGN